MRKFLYGLALAVVIVAVGLLYRYVVERPPEQVACPLDAKVCPDGTAVGRTGLSCTFPVCPPPNTSLSDIGVAFAIPAGFSPGEATDPATVAAYDNFASSTSASIVIRRYSVNASSTPLDVIRQTAIGGASGEPLPSTAFSSEVIGNYRFTVAAIGRFEGVIDTAYYFARNKDVLRFDAIDRGADWTNPSLGVSKLPAHASLRALLSTLQAR
ncbi:hypothetical protein HYV30_02965 [Candidatus Kaiserbacteria bacterium]|nr:hypothetical protein [Candidatus Kaiserbacteria bacterium]